MIRLADIEAAVCDEFDVTRAEFHGISRLRHILDARIAFVGIARQITSKSLPEIGRYRSKDHTTILSNERSCKKSGPKMRNLMLWLCPQQSGRSA